MGFYREILDAMTGIFRAPLKSRMTFQVLDNPFIFQLTGSGRQCSIQVVNYI
jgi:hypothetical protein